MTAPSAVGCGAEVVHEPLRGDDARLRAGDAVLEVQHAEEELRLGTQLQLPERLEEAHVDVVALHGEVDPVERATEAQRQRVRDLDERLRVEGPLGVMALVAVAEVVAELHVAGHAATEPHEAFDDARPGVGEPRRHDAVEHGELEVGVPLHGELIVWDRVEDRRELGQHRRLVERFDASLVFGSDERGDRRERGRQRHLEAALRGDQAVALAAGEDAVRAGGRLRVAELLEAQGVDRLVVADAQPRQGTVRVGAGWAHLELGPGAEHRVLPHDPVGPGAGFAVRDPVDSVAELRCRQLEHLVGAPKGDTSDEQHPARDHAIGLDTAARLACRFRCHACTSVARRSQSLARPGAGQAQRSPLTNEGGEQCAMRIGAPCALRSHCEHISGRLTPLLNCIAPLYGAPGPHPTGGGVGGAVAGESIFQTRIVTRDIGRVHS